MTPDQQILNILRKEAILLSQQVLSSPISEQLFKKECPLLRPLDICSKTKKCPSTVSMNPPESVHDAAIHTIGYYRNNYNRYNKELYYYFNVKYLNPGIISRLHTWAFIAYLNVFEIQNILRRQDVVIGILSVSRTRFLPMFIAFLFLFLFSSLNLLGCKP